MIKILASIVLIFGFVAISSSTCDFSSDFCSMSGMTCPSISNTIRIGDETYRAADLDVISFNDITITHGDVQRRVATRNNFYGLNGISVGDLITDDLSYSLIVGGDIVWNDAGEVFPLNKAVFVDGSSSVPANLAQRMTGKCSSSGCLDSSFDSLSSYWSDFSSKLASQSDNVDITYSEGIATLTCRSSDAKVYVVHVSPASFNQIIGYSFSGCSSSASWAINIIGNEDIVFSGNSMETSGYVIFNVGPSTRVILSSSVNGNIVAPFSDVNMIGGTVYGQVIAGNITNIVQVNQPNCHSTDSNASTAGSSDDDDDDDDSSSSSSGNSGNSGNSGLEGTDINGQSNNNENGNGNSGALAMTVSVVSIMIMIVLV